VILIEGLRKSYGALKAVDGLSVEVRPGETFGLLGPNGAGKTTTLHCVVGALSPDAGRIVIAGETDPSRPSVRSRIGAAPQALALYPELSAEENLRFFGRLYGLGGARLRERVAWALEFAGLTERRRDRVAVYSGGMQRRLNLACAVVHDPAVLLLDEPTVGVDPQSRTRIFESIDALRREGRTVMYTTHYMEEAQRLCDRVAIMDGGRILALDTVDALITRHGGPSVIDAEVDGRAVRIETSSPNEEVAKLASAGRLGRLRVDRPDLEAVFLALTGRTLRDE